MKRFIVTKKQLNEYIQKKKTEKVFYDILENLHNNSKFLNENISREKANQTVIDDYVRKNLITQNVAEMLIKNKVTDITGRII
jgi:hypothetical protein